jgi:hypothetical protein
MTSGTSWGKVLLGEYFPICVPCQIADHSVVTKGVEIATKRAIALKKLITHNPRDGVSSFPVLTDI